MMNWFKKIWDMLQPLFGTGDPYDAYFDNWVMRLKDDSNARE